ncbi:MAG: hypothetical protein ACYDG3_10045 [Bacillati bacterium]
MGATIDIVRQQEIARLGNILVKINEAKSLVEDAAAHSETMYDTYLQFSTDIDSIIERISDAINDLKV